MSTDIMVPTLGESVTTATVARWLKKAGESVAADEPLVELETDKVTVEVNAPSAGTMGTIAADEGVEVEVGALLGTLEAGGAAKTGGAPTATAPSVQVPPQAAANPQPGVNPPPAPRGPVARPAAAEHPAMPSAAKIMAEKGVDAADVPGTGKDARVTKGDVLAFLSRPAPAAAPAAPRPSREAQPGEERVKMTRLRRTIAVRLKEAQNNAAMLTTFNEVDMSAAMAMRTQYKDAFEKAHTGARLGFMSIFVQACVAALKAFPAVNAEIDGDEIVYHHHVHMGIAVGGANGLVVPVLRHADDMGFAAIERAIGDFGRRARAVVNSPDWRTRSSRVWASSGMSPISSRNNVPPAACSKRPAARAAAPVNAPRSWPNSSASISSRGIAAMLIATNGAARRGPRSWSARATSSFPVPDSPRIMTVSVVGTTRAMVR